jgi:sugar/nucleoside kinase (ribokinase family)
VAKFLKDLLGSREPLFAFTIQQLEAATGRQGTDIAYMADITERAHAVMRQIKLDTADTTPIELYNALNAHANDVGLFDTTADVGLVYDGGEVVSFNIDDIKDNQQRTFDDRSVRFVQCKVQLGIIDRYTAIASNKDDILTLAHQAKLDVCDLEEYHMEPVEQTQNSQSQAPSILCIGDIFTDAFIKLSPDVAYVDKSDDGNKWLNIPFGGRPPYEEVEIVQSVGPAPNAAVSCARLGLDVQLMSWLGDDEAGVNSLKYLAEQNVGADRVVQKQGAKSNYYYVLRLGAERTILTKDEEYDYTWHEPSVVPDWVYLASISGESWPLHEELAAYLEAHPSTKFVLQPGTFHFSWGAEKMDRLFKRADLIILNREEAMMLTGKGYDSIQELANGLHERGAKVAVITDGPSGSYASYDGTLVVMQNYPDPAEPYDRTGAGDAFASTIVAALALGQPMEVALQWAPINSMSVVQKLGAQAGLLNRDEIAEYLATAPEGYDAKEYQG